MAKKKKRGAQLRVVSGAAARPRTKLERERDARIEIRRLEWAARHPLAAQDERALRIHNLATRERWKHKRKATPQTLEHNARTREGSLARLYKSGAIDGAQLEAGAAIARAAALIMREVDVRVMNLERVDRDTSGDAHWEPLGRVWTEAAYSAWRGAIGPQAHFVLAIVIEDLGIAEAARKHRMSARRGRAILIGALELWNEKHSQARHDIDDAALGRVQAAIL